MDIKQKRLLQQHSATRRDDENRHSLRDIHYAEGYAVASDGYNLVALKQANPQAYESKTLDRQGKEINERYPDINTIFSAKAEAVIRLDQLQKGLWSMQRDEAERRKKYAQEGRIGEYSPAWRVLRILDSRGNDVFCVAELTLSKFIAALNAIRAKRAIISNNMRADTRLGRAACTYAVPGDADIITTITI